MRNDSPRELHMLNSRLLLRGALCFYALRVCCHCFRLAFALETPRAQTEDSIKLALDPANHLIEPGKAKDDVLRTWVVLILHPFQG
jgi:hypothetical protein